MSAQELFPEGWKEARRILVILAHPDDPEFFCGAAIARWTAAGHEVRYALLTRGDKGVKEQPADPQELIARRCAEQRAAAAILGVQSIRYLDFEDGYLVPDLETRRQVVRVLRQERPDVVVTCDPTHFFFSENYINHPDHRAAGQVVMDAVFPAAGNPMFFPELLQEGLLPCAVREVWFSLPAQPNVQLDVTQTWELRLRALHEHRSQVGDDLMAFDQRQRSFHTSDSTPDMPRYEHSFRRVVFR